MNKTKAQLLSLCMILIAVIVATIGFTSPEKLLSKEGVYYYIPIYDYMDSDNDGIGDLRGIINNLDSLNDANPNTNTDLGVNGIVLSPVYHTKGLLKNEPINYLEIDSDYGNMVDLQELISESNKRGMKLILEMEFNHTSINHEWFEQALMKPDSPFTSYYNIRDIDLNQNNDTQLVNESKLWHRANNIEYFSFNGRELADLNYDNTDMRNEIKEIAIFYIEKGVKGLKLNNINNIYTYYEEPDEDARLEKNLAWWQSFKLACKEVNKEIYLIGDIDDRAAVIAPYYKELNTLMNGFLADRAIPYIINSKKDMSSENGMFTKQLRNINTSYKTYSKTIIDGLYLSNNQDKIMSKVKDNPQKAKLAASIMMTIPGNPFIYYGDELGINNQKTQSPDTTIFNHYTELIRMHQLHSALKLGSLIETSDENVSVISYIRYDAKTKENLLVIHNLSDKPQETFIRELKSYSDKDIIFSTSNQDILDKNLNKVTIQGYSSLIISLD